MSWFIDQTNIVGFMQIVLDVSLIAFVVVLLKGRRKSDGEGQEIVQSIDKLMNETKAIAQELEANLQERHRLIQQVVGKLDQRLEEARELCQKLDTLNKEAHSNVLSPALALPNRDPCHREIVRLARLGLDARSISERVQKPLGEVELVLSLKRLSPEG